MNVVTSAEEEYLYQVYEWKLQAAQLEKQIKSKTSLKVDLTKPKTPKKVTSTPKKPKPKEPKPVPKVKEAKVKLPPKKRGRPKKIPEKPKRTAVLVDKDDNIYFFENEL